MSGQEEYDCRLCDTHVRFTDDDEQRARGLCMACDHCTRRGWLNPAERDTALRQRDEARAALEFYASEATYDEDKTDFKWQGWGGPEYWCPIEHDRGDSARAVLGRLDDAAPGVARPPEAGA